MVKQIQQINSKEWPSRPKHLVELKIFTNATKYKIQNTGYHATWGENPCLSSGGVAGGRGEGTGLLRRLPWPPGDEREQRAIIETLRHINHRKSLSLAECWSDIKKTPRLRMVMLIRELGTAGSTVGWASGLGTVSKQKYSDIYQIMVPSCCIFTLKRLRIAVKE